MFRQRPDPRVLEDRLQGLCQLCGKAHYVARVDTVTRSNQWGEGQPAVQCRGQWRGRACPGIVYLWLEVREMEVKDCWEQLVPLVRAVVDGLAEMATPPSGRTVFALGTQFGMWYARLRQRIEVGPSANPRYSDTVSRHLKDAVTKGGELLGWPVKETRDLDQDWCLVVHERRGG